MISAYQKLNIDINTSRKIEKRSPWQRREKYLNFLNLSRFPSALRFSNRADPGGYDNSSIRKNRDEIRAIAVRQGEGDPGVPLLDIVLSSLPSAGRLSFLPGAIRSLL